MKEVMQFLSIKIPNFAEEFKNVSGFRSLRVALDSFFFLFYLFGMEEKTTGLFVKVNPDCSKEYVVSFTDIPRQPVHPLPKISAIKGEYFLGRIEQVFQ